MPDTSMLIGIAIGGTLGVVVGIVAFIWLLNNSVGPKW